MICLIFLSFAWMINFSVTVIFLLKEKAIGNSSLRDLSNLRTLFTQRNLKISDNSSHVAIELFILWGLICEKLFIRYFTPHVKETGCIIFRL